MINPDYSIDEIEKRFFSYLSGRLGNLIVVEHLKKMEGGFEAYLYKFKISGIKDHDGRLVLRLFPSYAHEKAATWQAMIHNLLREEGLPVPRVYLSSSDKSVLGGPFLVMDFVENEVVNINDDPLILILTAKTQAMLHLKDGTRISEQIITQGYNAESHNFDGRINWLVEKGKGYPGLDEAVKWLIENRPPEPVTPKIVHGDFHPRNLLFKDGEVTAILDWSGFMVGDPMYGLGWTKAIFRAMGKPELPLDVLDQLVKMYTDTYESIHPIDSPKMNYYVVYRLVRALIEGKEGQEVWARPVIVDNIIKEIKEMTGILIQI